MAVIQQLTANLRNLSGKLIVTATPGDLEALQVIAVELAARPEVTTNGDIIVLPPSPVPPPPDGEQPE